MSGLVYDCNTADWPPSDVWRLAFRAWLIAHGVDADTTHRVEFHLIDAPLIRVFQIALNDDGRIYTDPSTRRIAERPPFDVLITTPPPRPEDYG